jgi:hypothetical protein
MMCTNSKQFQKTKSLIELEEALQVLLPDKKILAMINEIAEFQEIILLLNLAWFLTNQMILSKLMMAAMIVILL